jgi:hypothetical protein
MNYRHISRLRAQHRELEILLREEQRRPHPNALAIQDLKRRKLQVKDEIFIAEAGLAPVTDRLNYA